MCKCPAVPSCPGLDTHNDVSLLGVQLLACAECHSNGLTAFAISFATDPAPQTHTALRKGCISMPCSRGSRRHQELSPCCSTASINAREQPELQWPTLASSRAAGAALPSSSAISSRPVSCTTAPPFCGQRVNRLNASGQSTQQQLQHRLLLGEPFLASLKACCLYHHGCLFRPQQEASGQLIESLGTPAVEVAACSST